MMNVGTVAANLINKEMYEYSKTVEIFEYLILAVLGISIPLLFQHPQLLVGSTINFVLIMSSTNVKGWGKVMSLITFPSVSALLGTYLFGPFQIFLLYMIPFIWISNAILVFMFKQFYVSKKFMFLLTLLMASILKMLFLYSAAMMLIKLTVIPAVAAPVFATSMGILQLQTALIGGGIAFAVNQVLKIFKSSYLNN